METKESIINNINLQKETDKKAAVLKKITEAKFYLINGNIAKAKRLLLQMQNTNLLGQKMSARLMGIIAFIEGNYEDSLKHFGHKSLITDHDYKKFCFLKVLDLMILNKIRRLKKEFDRCHTLNFDGTDTEHLWLQSLIKIKLKDTTPLKENYVRDFLNQTYEVSLPMLRVLLKLAIYLNLEKSLHDLMYIIPTKFYEFSEIRELMGIIFYRLGKQKEAFEFIDDLQTPNAENVKGNMRLEKREFELAFGHFQMALKKKANSANAIERSIPLAYVLKQWDKGIQLVKKIRIRKDNIKKKISLLTAFQIQAGHFQDAEKNLQELQKLFQGKIPFEVLILSSYNALMIDDQDSLKKFSEASCRSYDALNCWILLQTSLWENLSRTIQRKEEVYDDKDLTLESLKEKVDLDPLVEPIYVHQRDIEEMDERSFELKY